MDDKKEFDPKAAAEARKKEMEDMTTRLEAGVKDVFQGDNYKQYLDFCSRLPRYSLNNQILIMLQKPDATMCQSFTGWKEMGRFVKKGEKGIRVLAPAPYKVEREQDKLDINGKPVLDWDGEPVKEIVEVKVTAFKPVSTFDISQTEGDPVPQFGVDELIGTVEGYATLMEAIKQASPVPIEFENIESGAKGYFHVEENRIAIQEGMSEAQTIKTALHEASHAMLHSKEAMSGNAENKSRSQKECEAESVAFVVCQHFGVDTSEYSFPYVAGWSSDKEIPELKASLETIRSTASALIAKIEENVQTLITVKEMDEFIQVHGDELPFGDSVGDRPEGYIEITPPVDMSSIDTSRTIKLSAENEGKEDANMPTQQQKKALNSAHKRAKKRERAEKRSVKDQISEKKEEAAKKPKAKQNDTQKLGEAI